MPKVRRRAGRREPYRHRHLIRSRPNRVTFLLNTQADISPERRQPQSDDRPTHVAHFTAAFYTLAQELALPAQSLGFPNPLMCPISLTVHSGFSIAPRASVEHLDPYLHCSGI